MYLVPLKTLLKTALDLTFTNEYPNVDFRNLHSSLEYPNSSEQYPGVLVDYEDSRPLQIAGINHVEYGNPPGQNTGITPYSRWLYAGQATFTIYALSSLERDRLYDELVRVIAFSRDNAAMAAFRSYIENNEFIGCEFDWDQIEARGKGEAPGTDFGTDEIVYEITLGMECFGEFVSDGTSGLLVPLSAIIVHEYGAGDVDPDTNPATNVATATGGPYDQTDPTEWH